MPRINPERLMADLKALRAIGAVETGVVRPALSDKDMEARRWLAGRFREAGLDVTVDGVANVIGRSRKNGPALLVGSHSDTQPRGGWLDGALGVIYGLEIVRALAEDPETAGFAVDAVSWQDEEGTFMSCLGSRSWCGTLDPVAAQAAKSTAGQSLADAIRAAGLEGTPPARFEPGRYVGYLEAHIEQGAYLEEAGDKIGVVTGIVGIRGMQIRFTGEQNHAGTTTMRRRKDAAMALFHLAVEIDEAFKAMVNERTVWTIGRVEVRPGAASIVPGEAELSLQFRDLDDGLLDRMEATVMSLVEAADRGGKVRVAAERSRVPIRPTRMDEALQAAIAEAAGRHAEGRWKSMPSAAGHDPMVLVERLPCAMLFIPSIGGISHDFAEDTAEADIVLGCQVLADAAASILARARR